MALPFGAAGKSLASAAKTGAAMGAAYNPGDEAGVIDPLQIKERAINAAVGGASGAAIQAPLNIISKAARRSKLVGAMKKPTQFADDMTEEGRQIISKAKKKFVAPEAAKLKEAIKGSTYEINPSRIRGISKGLDAVADRLEKRAGDSGRATMSANRTLRLKRILQRHSKFSQTEALAMPSKTITAKKANQARKILEKQINQNPKAANINKSLNKALSNIDRFGKKVESDSIGAFKAGVGTTKRGRYADVAEKAGVDYAEKADDLNAALKASKLSPEGFLHPLEFIKTGYGYAKRGAGAVARPIDAIASPLRTPKAQQSIQRALAEKRRK